MSLVKTLYPLLSTVQPRKIHPDMTKNIDWDIKNQIDQTNKQRFLLISFVINSRVDWSCHRSI